MQTNDQPLLFANAQIQSAQSSTETLFVKNKPDNLGLIFTEYLGNGCVGTPFSYTTIATTGSQGLFFNASAKFSQPTIGTYSISCNGGSFTSSSSSSNMDSIVGTAQYQWQLGECRKNPSTYYYAAQSCSSPLPYSYTQLTYSSVVGLSLGVIIASICCLVCGFVGGNIMGKKMSSAAFGATNKVQSYPNLYPLQNVQVDFTQQPSNLNQINPMQMSSKRSSIQNQLQLGDVQLQQQPPFKRAFTTSSAPPRLITK